MSVERTKPCEERIDHYLESRLADLLPDFDTWDLLQCKAYLDEHQLDYPWEGNPWCEDPVELMERLGFSYYFDADRQLRDGEEPEDDDAPPGVLITEDSLFHLQGAALEYALDLGDDWGRIDDWREACKEHHWDPEERDNDLLGVGYRRVYTAQLSRGGPSDEFEFHFDEDDDLVEAFYVFMDWFDGARRKVDVATAEALCERWCIGPHY